MRSVRPVKLPRNIDDWDFMVFLLFFFSFVFRHFLSNIDYSVTNIALKIVSKRAHRLFIDPEICFGVTRTMTNSIQKKKKLHKITNYVKRHGLLEVLRRTANVCKWIFVFHTHTYTSKGNKCGNEHKLEWTNLLREHGRFSVAFTAHSCLGNLISTIARIHTVVVRQFDKLARSRNLGGLQVLKV